MSFIKEKVQVTCDQLKLIANKKISVLENIEYVEAIGYKTDDTFPTNGWKPFPKGTFLNGRDAHFWLRTAFRTPAKKENVSYYVKCVTGLEGLVDSTNPQGLIYLNGEMVQGCDTNHTEIYVEPDTDYILHDYFYIGLLASYVPLTFTLYELDEKTEKLYYDMKVAFDSCILNPAHTSEYISVMTVLEQTANLIDLRVPYSKEYYASIDKALEFIHEELYVKLCSTEDKPIVSCIGHTHIDIEWLWARAQTREKIQRSFATANTLMQKYPEYRFTLTQPELYRYLKEDAPHKYAELKALVEEGRWEPEGAMYVEADCNLISGESLVRQLVEGKRFFKKEFDKDCKVLFLPDVFGYSAALPQILKKCDIDHFVTSKISWSETNMMPVDTFMWEGIDGTEIFTNFITTQKYIGTEYQNFTDYVGHLYPCEIKGTWNRFLQKEYSKLTMSSYGYGDGGGGPTKEMLETQRRLAYGLPGMPVTETSSLLSHLDRKLVEFEEGCKKTKRTPKWVGELYLEMHRGTYTSIGKIKRDNRKAELGLQKAETISYIDLLNGGNYDAEGIHNRWITVLHNQFHDIIPGSSIKEVYEGTDKDYEEIQNYLTDTVNSKLCNFANAMNTEGGTLVYNPSGFARKGAYSLNGETVELAEEIPALGWKVVNNSKTKTDVTVNGLTAENKFYKLTIDKSGRITELFDKINCRKVFKENEFGNELQIFEDFPRDYDNWEITDFYKQKMWLLDGEAEITSITDGSRAGFKVVHKYFSSEIAQNIWLYSENARIDFETEINWHEQHQLIKAAFPVDVHTNSAIYETQFGHIERASHSNTSWDEAKFEVCGHKWAVVAENNYGLALLNDCKYGHNAEGSTLKLTLLKCGTYPDEVADQGKHLITYSIMPFSGNFREAGVIAEAYALNQPLSAVEIKANNGKLADCFSLVSCDKENIIVETAKKAEDDNSLIVRMYDSFDRRTTATITVAEGFKKAYLCNMMETEIEELEFTDNKVTLPVSNFEIVTLKFTE